MHCGTCFDLNTIISLRPTPCLWQLTPPVPPNFSLQSSCPPNQLNPLMNSSLSWDRLQLTLSLLFCPTLAERAHTAHVLNFTTMGTQLITGISYYTWSQRKSISFNIKISEIKIRRSVLWDVFGLFSSAEVDLELFSVQEEITLMLIIASC